MKIERMFLNTTKPDKAGFCIGPKAFYTVNMAFVIGKFIVAMFYTEMFLIANINKAIIAFPAIGMDYAFKANMPFNNV